MDEVWKTIKAHPYWALGIGAATLLLIYIGQRNAAQAASNNSSVYGGTDPQVESAAIAAGTQYAEAQLAATQQNNQTSAALSAQQDNNQTALAIATLQAAYQTNATNVAGATTMDQNQLEAQVAEGQQATDISLANINANLQTNLAGIQMEGLENNNATLLGINQNNNATQVSIAQIGSNTSLGIAQIESNTAIANIQASAATEADLIAALTNNRNTGSTTPPQPTNNAPTFDQAFSMVQQAYATDFGGSPADYTPNPNGGFWTNYVQAANPSQNVLNADILGASKGGPLPIIPGATS